MAILNFPTNPALGDQYTVSGVTYTWNGYAWLKTNNGNQTFNNITGTNSITVGTGTNTVIITSSTIVISGDNVLTTSSLFKFLVPGPDISITASSGFATVSDISTLQTVTSRGSTSTYVITLANTTNSTSTDSGALVVVGGAAFGKDVTVGGDLYVDGTVFVQGASLSGIDKITGSTGTFANAKVVGTTPSISTSTGALTVEGGVGVGGDMWVEGRINSESLKIADSIFDSTQVLVNTTATVVVDSYSSTSFRSAKYLIQIDEGAGAGANFEVVEILLLVDNIGTVYATEYGLLTSGGELGEFAADVQGDNIVRLYFTPYVATNKVIKVLRTGMTV